MIKHLKPNNAIGLDKVSVRLLKDAVEVVAPIITSFFKLAKVTPLFKKRKRQDPLNYRPISFCTANDKQNSGKIYTCSFLHLPE